MLEVFRKNQRYTVAILGVVAMMSFVVLPLVQQYYQSQTLSTAPKAEKIRFAGGEVGPEKIEQFRMIHGQTTNLLGRLAQMVLQRGGMPRVPGFVMSQQGVVRPGIELDNSRGHAVQTSVMSYEARRQGFDISDDTIDQWIVDFTDNKVTGPEVNEALKQVAEGTLGRNQLYGHLKDELLADLMDRMGCVGLNGRGESSMAGRSMIVTPAAAWKNFLKINQAATIATFPVLTEDFLDKTPTSFPESEINALYEEAKDRFPSVDSSEPGIRRPYRADVEYVYASLDQFIEQAKSELKEEQLREEYDKRVASGSYVINETKAANPAATESPPTTENPPADSTDKDAPAAEMKKSESAEEPKKEAAVPTTAPAIPQTPDSKVPAAPSQEPAPAGSAPTTTPSAEPVKTEPPTPEPPKTEPAPNSQSSRNKPSVRLVAMRYQDPPIGNNEPVAATETPATKAEPGPQTETKTDQPSDQPATTTEKTPEAAKALDSTTKADAPSSDSKPADEPPAKPTDPTTPPTTNPPTPELPASAGPAEKKVRPFEEVREEIARALAVPVAVERRRQAMQNARTEMREYFLKHSGYQAATKAGKKVEQPTPPNLEKLAEKYGLKAGKTGVQDAVSVRSQTIGASMSQDGRQQFASIVFNNEAPLFYAQETFNFSSSEGFVFWKTLGEKEFVPTKEQAREDLVQALRLREARKLARAEAQRISDAASKSDVSLKEVVKDTQRNLVQENVGPFTWMQAFGMQRTLRSIVNGVDRPGEEFMKQVFATPLNKFSVAPNEPESVFYVVKVEKLTPEVDSLHESFMKATDRMQTQSLASNDYIRLRQDWYEDLRKRLDLKVPDDFE